MEIEKEDLSAGLAKPEFKPFQNDGKRARTFFARSIFLFFCLVPFFFFFFT